MKALIVHLSDIHIQGEDDHVLNRARQISSAVRNLEYDLAACFIVVSGDTAYSGTDDQYWAAVDFMEELRGTLATDLRIRTEVRYVVVPGNHDCDFSGSTEVRDVLLDSIEKDPKLASNDEMIKTCTTTQDNYFAYLRLLDDESDDRRVYSRLYYDYQFEVGQKPWCFGALTLLGFPGCERRQASSYTRWIRSRKVAMKPMLWFLSFIILTIGCSRTMLGSSGSMLRVPQTSSSRMAATVTDCGREPMDINPPYS